MSSSSSSSAAAAWYGVCSFNGIVCSCVCCRREKEKFQIDYKDEAVRGVLAVDAGTVTWPAPQKPPPPPPAKKEEVEVRSMQIGGLYACTYSSGIDTSGVGGSVCVSMCWHLYWIGPVRFAE